MASTASDDAALAVRLRRGDFEALDPLFRRHAPALLRLAHQITGSAADAEDVVQDVFVGLPRALGRYEERGTFGEWLRGVAVRTALAHLRRDGRRREDVLDERTAHLARTRNLVEEIALSDAILRLPAPLRAVFVLKVVVGYSHAEIAKLLDIRPNTSEVRLFRAVRVLRDHLHGSST
jgi:RNA polymerase sigma-70 factor (ECF subfamily)